MIKNNRTKVLLGIVGGLVLTLGGAATAFADSHSLDRDVARLDKEITRLPLFTIASTTATTSPRLFTNQTKQLSQVIKKGDSEITSRINDLNKLNTKVQAMKNVSAAGKATVATEVSTEVSALTALKTKIDADTDLTVAKADEKAIFAPIRIYALIIPQYNVLVSADRVGSVADLLTTIGEKLQTRITAAQTAGKDVSAMQTALADMNVKIADAKSQASLATTTVINLKPDNGDQTVAQSNKAALVSAKATIKTATSDLKTAKQDASNIVQSLKKLK